MNPDSQIDRSKPPVLALKTNVRGYTVSQHLDDAMPGMHEVLAKDAAGASVILRVPGDLVTAGRMRQEAELAKRHKHQAIVQSVGVVEHDQWPVQVLEHVDGMRLDTLCLIAGALAPQSACRIGWQIALALTELHQKMPMVAHGALSTERILIDIHGNARLRDVGRLLPDQAERSMSPERRNGKTGASAPDDIFALGLIVAEAALGHPLETAGSFLDARVLDGLIPERLVDALGALLSPLSSRIANTAAAVRIFVELEYAFGDGNKALRQSLERARLGLAFGGVEETDGQDEDKALDDEELRGPVTMPDGGPPTLTAAAVANAAAARVVAAKAPIAALSDVDATEDSAEHPMRAKAEIPPEMREDDEPASDDDESDGEADPTIPLTVTARNNVARREAEVQRKHEQQKAQATHQKAKPAPVLAKPAPAKAQGTVADVTSDDDKVPAVVANDNDDDLDFMPKKSNRNLIVALLASTMVLAAVIAPAIVAAMALSDLTSALTAMTAPADGHAGDLGALAGLNALGTGDTAINDKDAKDAAEALKGLAALAAAADAANKDGAKNGDDPFKGMDFAAMADKAAKDAKAESAKSEDSSFFGIDLGSFFKDDAKPAADVKIADAKPEAKADDSFFKMPDLSVDGLMAMIGLSDKPEAKDAAQDADAKKLEAALNAAFAQANPAMPEGDAKAEAASAFTTSTSAKPGKHDAHAVAAHPAAVAQPVAHEPVAAPVHAAQPVAHEAKPAHAAHEAPPAKPAHTAAAPAKHKGLSFDDDTAQAREVLGAAHEEVAAPKPAPVKEAAAPVESGRAVKLTIGLDDSARSSAESHLRACKLTGNVVGVVHVGASSVAVSAQPKNACVIKVLSKAFRAGIADEEPFEINLE